MEKCKIYKLMRAAMSFLNLKRDTIMRSRNRFKRYKDKT